MGIGCSMWSFHRTIREGKMDLFDFVDTCAGLDIKDLELLDMFMQCDPMYVDRVLEAVNRAGSRTVCVTLHPRLLVDDEWERKSQVTYVNCWVDVAHKLGSSVVRVNLAGTREEELGVARAVEALKPITAHAAKQGIKIALENHGTPVRTADQILSLIKKVGADNLGSLPDFGNFPEEVRYDEIEKIAGVAYHCHAKTGTFNAEGDLVAYDLARCLQIMKDAGYAGSWCIEYSAKFDEITTSELDGVKKSKALLEKCL